MTFQMSKKWKPTVRRKNPESKSFLIFKQISQGDCFKFEKFYYLVIFYIILSYFQFFKIFK